VTSIPDDLFSRLSKTYIVKLGDQTLLDALRVYREEDADESWFLVVNLDDGSHLVARFSDLQAHAEAKGQAAFSTPLKDLGEPLMPVAEVDQEAELDEAVKAASGNPARIAVVTWGGDAVVGLLEVTEGGETPTTSAPAPAPAPSAEKGDVVGGDKITVGDIMGTKGVAIGDGAQVTVTEITEVTEVAPTFETGPEWLRKAVAYVQQNVLLAVIGFAIFVLVPTTWFIVNEVIPSLTPQTMTGEWKVAVASFTPVGDERVKPRETRQISESVAGRLESELSELGEEIDIQIGVWGPDQTGTINGDTPEERIANAEARAHAIEADIIVYGTVERVGNSLRVQPEFYVDIENFYEAEEVVGGYSIGSEITIADVSVAQIGLNRELARRSETLSLITGGLSYYFINEFEKALDQFERANDDSRWVSDEGRETIYVLQGNAAFRSELMDEAETAFEAALDIEPEYARAYVGLGSIYYRRSLESVTEESPFADEALLDQALETYDQALTASISPSSAEVPTRVAFNIGQIYLVQWLMGEDTKDQAIEEFGTVIEAYGEGANPRVREQAAEAHARLGLIAQIEGDTEQAIEEWLIAVELSEIPSRNAAHHARLADLYADQDDSSKAEAANNQSISDYRLAVSATTRPELQADYYAAIATRYEKLGDTAEAATALRRAISLLPEDDEDRLEYQRRLDELG
jgi:tetratricopeptide (TPR) repeat protein